MHYRVLINITANQSIDNGDKLNIKDNARKAHKYDNIILDISDSGYKVNYIPVEVGSRGNIGKFKQFRNVTGIKSTFASLRNTLFKTTLVASYIVFYSEFDPMWSDPPYVSF